jgi:hypothetical protein
VWHRFPTGDAVWHRFPTGDVAWHRFPTGDVVWHRFPTGDVAWHRFPTGDVVWHRFPTGVPRGLADSTPPPLKRRGTRRWGTRCPQSASICVIAACVSSPQWGDSTPPPLKRWGTQCVAPVSNRCPAWPRGFGSPTAEAAGHPHPPHTSIELDGPARTWINRPTGTRRGSTRPAPRGAAS